MENISLRHKIVAGLALVIVSITIVSALRHLGISDHVIDYIAITLSDLTAGAVIFFAIEHRLKNAEEKFEDERTLLFTISRVMTVLVDMQNLAKRIDQSIKVTGGGFPEINAYNGLRAKVQSILDQPDHWKFHGSEEIWTIVDMFLRIQSGTFVEVPDATTELGKKMFAIAKMPFKQRQEKTQTDLHRITELPELLKTSVEM